MKDKDLLSVLEYLRNKAISDYEIKQQMANKVGDVVIYLNQEIKAVEESIKKTEAKREPEPYPVSVNDLEINVSKLDLIVEEESAEQEQSATKIYPKKNPVLR